MKNVVLALLAVAGVCLITLICLVGYVVGTLNTETGLKNQVYAQIKVNQTNYDTMWKIISQKAEISDKYKQTFAEIYPELISGRYKTGGSLLKFITESNPNFDTSLLNQLSNAVEQYRVGFKLAQDKLIDLNLQHTNLIQKFPSGFVCTTFGRSEIPESDVVIVTSGKTKEVFEKGQDDDAKVFSK